MVKHTPPPHPHPTPYTVSHTCSPRKGGHRLLIQDRGFVLDQAQGCTCMRMRMWWCVASLPHLPSQCMWWCVWPACPTSSLNASALARSAMTSSAAVDMSICKADTRSCRVWGWDVGGGGRGLRLHAHL